MKRILVGFDGSEGSENALNKAMNIIDENGLIILLAVVPIPSNQKNLEGHNEQTLRNRANNIINNAIRDVGCHEFSLTGMVRESEDIASTIIDAASELKVEAIVLGSKGSSELGRYPIGSVANKVVQFAKTPVMVCR
jgi:nucleotide-binding universal stress UspA family protein